MSYARALRRSLIHGSAYAAHLELRRPGEMSDCVRKRGQSGRIRELLRPYPAAADGVRAPGDGRGPGLATSSRCAKRRGTSPNATIEFSILVRLRLAGEMTINALAKNLVMDRTTLGRNILPLERDGLIEIVPGDVDRRSKIVRL